jgi:hypothetical protein
MDPAREAIGTQLGASFAEAELGLSGRLPCDKEDLHNVP